MLPQIRAILLSLLTLSVVAGAGGAEPDTALRTIRMDVFVRSDRDSADRVAEYVDDLRDQTQGMEIRTFDLIKDRDALARFYELSKRAGRDKPVLPAFYVCDRMYFGFADAKTTGPEIQELWTAHIYTRATCSRCQSLKAFLPTIQSRWPAIRFVNHDVDRSTAARSTWQALCRGSGGVPGLPTIDFARRVIIGYQGDDVTGAQLNRLIEKVSGTRERLGRWSPKSGRSPHAVASSALKMVSWTTPTLLVAQLPADGLALPEEASAEQIGEAEIDPEPTRQDDTIDVPFFGKISASGLGMPLFTLTVGLVDGFNPCAMWVLVFLLSVLVNIRDRKKILMIAGTFVLVSGLAYYAFMAAWMSLFLLIGIRRPVQIALGVLALVIGVINVKDFFAFKRGISLSIPESSKPGLYRRVREITTAKYLGVALGGAIALAIIVNMIELLCTAGLPALYTQVLAMQDLPAWKNYSYLALYIFAYMLDDSILVAIVIATLSHRKLQEREGRVLKLISGLVILALGLVMLFRPGWLQLGA